MIFVRRFGISWGISVRKGYWLEYRVLILVMGRDYSLVCSNHTGYSHPYTGHTGYSLPYTDHTGYSLPHTDHTGYSLPYSDLTGYSLPYSDHSLPNNYHNGSEDYPVFCQVDTVGFVPGNKAAGSVI